MDGIRSRLRSLAGLTQDRPWSARIMGIAGLLLGLMSALDHYWVDQNETYRDWDEWVSLGLTLTLLIASAWFAADVRRMNKWAELSTELQAQVIDLQALHPDAVVAALQSVHDQPEAMAKGGELQEAAAELSRALIKERRAPSRKEIARLETAAQVALTPPPGKRDPAKVLNSSPEVMETWQSVAKLRSAMMLASSRLESAPAEPPSWSPDSFDATSNPQNRWTEFMAIAAVLVGLIATPTVVDAVSTNEREDIIVLDKNDGSEGDDDDSGREQTEPNGDEEALSEAQRQLRTDLEQLEALVAGLGSTIDSVVATSTGFSELQSELEGIRVALAPEEQDALVAPVVVGTSLWGYAKEHCPNNGSAREIAAHVRRIWADNAAILGADPNQLDPGQLLDHRCADGAG